MYEHRKSILSLVLLPVLLFSACSQTATVAQPQAATTTPEAASPTTVVVQPTATGIPTAAPTQTQAPEPTAAPAPLGIGSTRISEVDGMEQVYIPAGEFIMGSDDPEAKVAVEGGRAYPETPQHKITLDAYWIDKYEVTNEQYSKCVAAGGCKPPNLTKSYSRPKYYGEAQFANYPVLYVDWYMAVAYCKWAGRKLPSEAEWEKAARGTDGRKYPWGNEELTGERANFCDKDCPRTYANPNYNDGYPDTSPVGSYPKGVSPYGAMDMAGNVWEWTSTIIRPYPYSALDGRENMDIRSERVWRGGPWSNGTWWMRSSLRYRSVQTYYIGNLGLRCAAPADK